MKKLLDGHCRTGTAYFWQELLTAGRSLLSKRCGSGVSGEPWAVSSEAVGRQR